MLISKTQIQTHIHAAKRIILFGGVFDPVHNGHISIANAATKEFAAEGVAFLPERVPYRKQHCTSYAHRLKMLELATQDNPRLTVLDFPDDKQTIAGTFTWVNGLYPGHSFIWLLGSDAVGMLPSWPDVNMLRGLNVELIAVANREGAVDAASIEGVSRAVTLPVHSLDAPYPAVSSSQVRSSIVDAKDFLPPSVYKYIAANNLYS